MNIFFDVVLSLVLREALSWHEINMFGVWIAVNAPGSRLGVKVYKLLSYPLGIVDLLSTKMETFFAIVLTQVIRFSFELDVFVCIS